MDFSYIAGFLDADGSIHFESAGSHLPRVSIYQRHEMAWVLEDMKRFLLSQNIDARVFHGKPRKNHNLLKVKKEISGLSVLRIGRVRDVLTFLLLVYPYLMLKSNKAAEVMQYITCRRWRKSTNNFGGRAKQKQV